MMSESLLLMIVSIAIAVLPVWRSPMMSSRWPRPIGIIESMAFRPGCVGPLTGVSAVLLGFCQELGIRNVLTTEVINWAHGAVQEAVLAAQLMHFAQQQGTPPKHVDGRLLTVKDEEFRPYAESELRELQAQVTDPNFRIFADSDWIYVFNAELFVEGTDFTAIFDQLGVDEPTHAFYLGKELMKATIARALHKNYGQESPLDWGYRTFEEPRRERVRLTARRTK